MPKFTSLDAQINYQTFGDAAKPAIVFSNSLGTNFSMWKSQIEFFQKDFFVICYDTRGHGQSSTPQGPYSIEQLGTDVIHLLDHLNIQKAAFCGISMGGLIGQWLAIHHSSRFTHIVVCNTAAKIGQEQAWIDRANLVKNQGLQSIADTAATRWFTESFIQTHIAIVKSLSNDLAAGSAEGYANCCLALAKADLREDLVKINLPILVIAGIQDPVTTVEDGKFIQSKIQNAQLFEINASHISNIEQTDIFNEAVQKFIH